MNILFLMGKYPNYGGVEKVSTVLANEFISLGMQVSIVSFENVVPDLLNELHSDVEVYHFPERKVFKNSNVQFLREILTSRKIDFIINQWCLPFYVTMLCKKAIGKTSTKLLAVHHNVPDQNSKIQSIQMQLAISGIGFIKKRILEAKLLFIKKMTGFSMRYVYKKSDFYILLSERFKENFKNITKLTNISKVICLTNPLTTASFYTNDAWADKKNQILYVGRIENNQKRIFRLVDIWDKLDNLKWDLVIVGDGPDLQELKIKCKNKNFNNIYFEGFQNPISYYRDSKILVMVSEYEGLPLVLAESQSFGTVPIVYHSFNSLQDIVENNGNGRIVEPINGRFDNDAFSDSLLYLMENENVLKKMSVNSVKNAERFHINNIASEWNTIFLKLKNGNQ
jgi:glycosyltransferase involved in cell wall biosynthesis